MSATYPCLDLLDKSRKDRRNTRKSCRRRLCALREPTRGRRYSLFYLSRFRYTTPGRRGFLPGQRIYKLAENRCCRNRIERRGPGEQPHSRLPIRGSELSAREHPVQPSDTGIERENMKTKFRLISYSTPTYLASRFAAMRAATLPDVRFTEQGTGNHCHRMMEA